MKLMGNSAAGQEVSIVNEPALARSTRNASLGLKSVCDSDV
jgi:hypothetical protein